MGTTSENTRKYVSFLLDETGSMHSIKQDTIGGFNEYVDTLKKDGADIAFSLVSFNSNGTQSRYAAESIDAVPPLTNDNYQPTAATPLIDAAVKDVRDAALLGAVLAIAVMWVFVRRVAAPAAPAPGRD